jgi:thioredoxin-related protein
MKKLLIILLVAVTSFSIFAINPNFKLKGHNGKTYELSKLKGKYVVLEWYNEGCPFVRKFYDVGAMQKMQKEMKGNKDVVWLTISSSAKDRQGYIANTKVAAATYNREKMKSDALLMDEKGLAGKSFSAKTTPHMVIINKDGSLAYDGAIDSIASTKGSDIAKARPLFMNALALIASGKEMGFQKNKPYGCSVKY